MELDNIKDIFKDNIHEWDGFSKWIKKIKSLIVVVPSKFHKHIYRRMIIFEGAQDVHREFGGSICKKLSTGQIYTFNHFQIDHFCCLTNIINQ